MSHVVTIDHRAGKVHSPYRIERSPGGRPIKEYEPWPVSHAGRLARALSRSISGEVRFDEGSRALYATDASSYRQVPIGVVVPRTMDDVVTAIERCREFDAPIVLRGGGTSLAGQGCNVAVLIDFSKYLTGSCLSSPTGGWRA